MTGIPPDVFDLAMWPCPACEGRGRRPHAPGLDPEVWLTAECSACEGFGYMLDGSYKS